MLKPIEIPRHQNYSKNEARGGDGYPCVVCGKYIAKPTFMVHVGLGGSHLLDHDDNSEPNSDLGGYPIGSDCLRNHPELHAYATPVGA